MPSYSVTDVHLELTNLCNLTCIMCPVNREMKREKCTLDFNLIKKIVEENPKVKSYGLNNWGEPLLHPQFLEIIDYLTSKNKTFYFATNATLFNEEMIRKLIGSSLSAIFFSIDAIGDTYEEIRGYPYQKIKEKILAFLSARDAAQKKITTEIVATVSKWNETAIIALKNEWASYMKVSIQPMLTFERDQRLRKCDELFRSHLIVLSNGKVVPCCADYEGILEIGDAKKQTLNEIINSKEINRLRENAKGSICDSCSEYKSNITKERFKKKRKFFF